MLCSIPLPNSSGSGLYSEPLFRIEESLADLEAALGTALYWQDTTKIAALRTFKVEAVALAARVWGKDPTDTTTDVDGQGEAKGAVYYSEQFRQKVNAAIA